MTEIKINFAKTTCAIKPMHAVNNGPVPGNVRTSITNFDDYKAAKIPFARNHDASFFTGYGGEHIVDVHRIFKNFDADENDPASYIFEPTDEYLKTTVDAGTKVFYRLGAAIEHRYKYGTRVPKDYAKWARICEHIILHYNEGWANGFEYGIEYWEIWNEPDCRNHDGTNPCWQGTNEEFLDFYAVVAKYLKSRFPSIKLGGPAFTSPWPTEFKDAFLDMVAREKIPFDFYSYHWYGCELEKLAETINKANEELDKHGLCGTPTILNEWNYIRGWREEAWNYSLATEKNLKGSSFVLGAMCVGQALDLDMLMYYDARPCGMNGMFEAGTYKLLKPYYPFVMFSSLYELGTAVECPYVTDDIYVAAAKNSEKCAIVLTHFNDDDTKNKKDVKLCLSSLENSKAEVYVLDENKNLALTSVLYLSGDSADIYLDMPLYTSVLIKIEKA